MTGDPPPAPRPAASFSRAMQHYTRQKLLGEGSYGKALLVRNRRDHKQYVIKEINITRVSPGAAGRPAWTLGH